LSFPIPSLYFSILSLSIDLKDLSEHDEK
jgi:hypothetical protein